MRQPDAVMSTTVTVETPHGLEMNIAESVVIGEQIWLVLEWFALPDPKWRMPGRSVRVDSLRIQRMQESGFGTLLLQDSIPIAVMTCPIPPPPEMPYELVSFLELAVPAQPLH